MASSGMLVCSFFLKKRFKQGESDCFPLNQPFHFEQQDDHDNVFQLIQEFCRKNEEITDDERQQKLFSVQKDSFREYDENDYHCCSFIVKSGSYGVEGDITNRITQEVKYQRVEDDADIKGFQVIAYVPKDINGVIIYKGILVFRSISKYGVKSITTEHLKSFFAEYGLTFETRSVSVKAFIEKLIEQGNLYKLTLIYNRVSPNSTDNMFINRGREERSYTKPALRQEWLDKILSLFQRADETGIYEIPDEEGYDDISIQFRLGDRQRTVRLKNLEKLSIVEDIPSEIVQQRNPEAIINYMIQTADAYKEKMVFENGV